MVGIPKGRNFVEPFFSMYMRRTGVHRCRSVLSDSMMPWIFARDIPSTVSAVTPCVMAPSFRQIRPYARRYNAGLYSCR
jgi:hypothetical protein